jgi:hypothetical protein
MKNFLGIKCGHRQSCSLWKPSRHRRGTNESSDRSQSISEDCRHLNASHGILFRFHLTGNRQQIGVGDPALKDRVANNVARDDYFTEQSTVVLGTNFGIITDIQTGPNGHLYLLSIVATGQGKLDEISTR